MADSTPPTPPLTPENQEQKKRNLTPIYILVIALLLASNAYMYFSGKHTEAVQNTEISKDTARIDSLNTIYKKAVADINSYKGQDSTLNDSIKKIMGEISSVKAALLKARASGQMSETIFNKEKKLLADKVRNLTDQVAELQTKLNKQIVKNDSLGKEVADQEMKNSNLSTKLKVASAKVEVASALHASTIEAHGIKVSKNGKEKETPHASKADKIKVTFNVDDNKVTESGKKTIYLRMLTPEGTPIYNESEGSGTTTLNSGETLRYSVKGDFDYSNTMKSLAMYVKSSTGYSKGEYKIELYERGFQIGTSTFTLK